MRRGVFIRFQYFKYVGISTTTVFYGTLVFEEKLALRGRPHFNEYAGFLGRSTRRGELAADWSTVAGKHRFDASLFALGTGSYTFQVAADGSRSLRKKSESTFAPRQVV